MTGEPPVWSPDGRLVELWHPESPGMRVIVRARLWRRVLRRVNPGHTMAGIATLGEMVRRQEPATLKALWEKQYNQH